MEYAEIFYDRLVVETEEAVLLDFGSDDAFDANEVWIPKSVIKDGHEIDYETELRIEVEQWFAEKQELI